MKPNQAAIANLKKFLNQSEANRLKPKPVEKRAPEHEELSPEQAEALQSLSNEG